MGEMNLTIKQCVDLYDLPDVMTKADVECDWPTSIDIAMNKESVRAIAEGFRNSLKKPKRVQEYEHAVEKARMTLKDAALKEEIERLNREYAPDLLDERCRQERLNDAFTRESRKVRIVPIRRDAFSGGGKLVAIIASHLAPVFAPLDDAIADDQAAKPRRRKSRS